MSFPVPNEVFILAGVWDHTGLSGTQRLFLLCRRAPVQKSVYTRPLLQEVGTPAENCILNEILSLKLKTKDCGASGNGVEELRPQGQ